MAKKRSRQTPPAPAADLSNPQLYVNRELSLLSFQRRVLEEAEDESNPLLERVKFLAILGSNLSEFFMVRVAGLIAQVDAGTLETGPDRMSPAAQLIAIRREVKKLNADARRCLLDKLLPALAASRIEILDYAALDERQRATADLYFQDTVFPVLTPLAFDPGRPFPHISNLSLNLAVLIKDGQGNEHFARVKVPDSLPQLVPLHKPPKKRKAGVSPAAFVWLEQVIATNLAALFPGMEIVETHPFHVTRDADIAIKELEAEDLLETFEEGVRQRRFGDVVRLQVTDTMPQHILSILMSNLEVGSSEVYRVHAPLSLTRLMALYDLSRPDLKVHPFIPTVPPALVPASGEDDIWSLIRKQDVLAHHPFESFQPVIELLQKAAQDPNVLAIKMVLYRVGRNSPVVRALLEAAENGKQVAVLVELKARFDEESNIEWARALEDEGVHVVYGLVGLKIHCKIALIVRREGDLIRRYIHASTGNYNAVTSHLFTDLGFFTCREEIADDATHLFNYLTGYSVKADYSKLMVAPLNLRARMRQLIEREIRHQRSGRGGRLVFKMNSLVDEEMMRDLCRAAQQGVKIRLLIRGICCLRPGVPGVSENIEVVSIVGRFLEHSRIFYFQNGGDNEVYLGSADLMPRNLNRRVEALFPIEDPALVRRVKEEILAIYLSDNVKARVMQSDAVYGRRKRSGKVEAVNCQEWLIRKHAGGRAAAGL